MPTETLTTVAGQIAAGREQALVRDVSDRIKSDPATVRRLRGEGLTFPEVARTIVLSQRLGTDLPTTVRFVRGSLTSADLAAQLGISPKALQEAVQRAAGETRAIPALPPVSR